TAEGNDPDGFLFIGSSDMTISGNMAFYNRMRGITFEGCQGCLATGNISHSHGVLGFAIYGSMDMTLAENVAYNNQYHGFAILHEAGSTTFRGNESYENEGAGFFKRRKKKRMIVIMMRVKEK
ncbi:MAG: right-handed parallel beta-helix repeat-containing protein, partial [Nitrospirota bacterium]